MKTISIENLKSRREQARLTAQQDYTRIITTAASNPELSERDAQALEGAITTLGITLEDLEGDIAAIKAHNTAKAGLVSPDELQRAGDEANALWKAVNDLTEQHRVELEKANIAANQASHASSFLRTQHVDALKDIESVKKARPRAFGVWN